MLLSYHQNTGQNHDIKIANRSFENVAQFRYLGMTVTNQNLIEEEIKWRLNSGNACYLLVTITERSKACTVFAHSEAGIVGSKPTQGMDV
jgi:hypothetical protein